MDNDKKQNIWETYKDGDETEDNRKIKKILGRKREAIVFLDHKDELIWMYDEGMCKLANDYILPAKKLQIRIYSSVPKDFQVRALNHLGSMLFNGLVKSASQGDAFDPSQYDFVEEYIETKIRENFHKVYLISGGCVALIMLLIWANFQFLVWGGKPPANTLLQSDIFKLLINGAFLGSLGALISIIQRFKNIQFQLYSSELSIILQGVTKVVLGIMFGAFIVLAVKAKIFLPEIIHNGEHYNPYVLAIISIGAGFSERLVPDFLEKIGTDSKAENIADKENGP